MKKNKLFIMLLSIISINFTAGATSSSFEINSNMDTRINSRNVVPTEDNMDKLSVMTWTHSGEMQVTRSLLQFPIPNIDNNITIDSVILFLHFLDTDHNESFSTHYGDNSMYVERITTSWTEPTLWTEKPETTDENRIEVPKFQSETQNYNINVTNLVSDMIVDSENSYGFMIRQIDEVNIYRGSLFCGGKHAEEHKRPKLIFYVSENNTNCTVYDTVTTYIEVIDTTIIEERVTITDTIQHCDTLTIEKIIVVNDSSSNFEINSTMDTRINSRNVVPTEDNMDKLSVMTWTHSGGMQVTRSLLQFPIPNIDNNITIDSVILFLHFLDTDHNESFSTHYGDNSMYVERITTSWTEPTLWTEKPETTDKNRIEVPKFQSETQNYNINVTNLVSDMIVDSENSYGFMIRQIDEGNIYRGSLFCGGKHAEEHKRPKLIFYVSDNNTNCTVYDTVTTYIEVIDTTIIEERVTITDTLYNYIKVYDTINVEIIVPVYDTIIVEQIVNIYDTIVIIDSVINLITIEDVILIHDTIKEYVTIYETVTDTLIISLPTSLNEKIFSDIKVYPNPTKDYINIKIDNITDFNNFTLKIVSTNGTIVYDDLLNVLNKQINIQELGGSGTYLFNIYNANNTLLETKKIIVQ
jgi:hypothetical protein